MGVEYRRYLIPRPNSFRPTPEALERLIDSLRRERWLLSPTAPERNNLRFGMMTYYAHARTSGFYVKQGQELGPGPAENLGAFLAANQDRDLLLSWPIESLGRAGLRYPLTPPPFQDEQGAMDCYYEFQLHLSHDYVYHYSEAISPFDDEPACRSCGESLVYSLGHEQDPFYDQRISLRCPSCGELFDSTGLPCTAYDLWTNKEYAIPGGVTYRFAVVVDCGKCFGNRSMKFATELKALVESVLGVATYEVDDAY